jgi:hypothetical protein
MTAALGSAVHHSIGYITPDRCARLISSPRLCANETSFRITIQLSLFALISPLAGRCAYLPSSGAALRLVSLLCLYAVTVRCKREKNRPLRISPPRTTSSRNPCNEALSCSEPSGLQPSGGLRKAAENEPSVKLVKILRFISVAHQV